MRRTRLLVAVPAALLLVSGCGSHDAPRPGVAAEVDGHVLTEHDLNTLVDARCVVDAAGQPTTRSIAAAQTLQDWVGAHVVLDYADRRHISYPQDQQDVATEPGWDKLTDAERAALQTFRDEQASAKAIAGTPGLKAPDAGDFDIVINPRYGIEVKGQQFVASGGLSVPVSKEAMADQKQPSAAQLKAMPAGQVCGNPDATGPAAG